jgi:hypothetical protein
MDSFRGWQCVKCGDVTLSVQGERCPMCIHPYCRGTEFKPLVVRRPTPAMLKAIKKEMA